MDDYEDVNEGLGTAPPDVGGAIGIPMSASQAYAARPAPAGRVPENISGYTPTDIAMMAAPMPLGMAGRALTMAPKTAAGILAALGLTAGAGQAGENKEDEFTWTDPDAERDKRIRLFEETMNNLNREMTRASKARMPSVQKAMDEAIRLNQQRLKERTKERDAAYATWQEKQATKKEAEKPFRERYPNAYQYGVPAAWLASLLGGMLGSKAGAPLRSAMSGAAGGGLASGFVGAAPTVYDAATLPTGSKPQAEASKWLASWKEPLEKNWWASRMVPEVLSGMLAGAVGGKYGSQVPRPGMAKPVKPESAPQAPKPEAPQAVPPSAPAAAAESLVPPKPGYVLNPTLTRIYGYPVWMKP